MAIAGDVDNAEVGDDCAESVDSEAESLPVQSRGNKVRSYRALVVASCPCSHQHVHIAGFLQMDPGEDVPSSKKKTNRIGYVGEIDLFHSARLI